MAKDEKRQKDKEQLYLKFNKKIEQTDRGLCDQLRSLNI